MKKIYKLISKLFRLILLFVDRMSYLKSATIFLCPLCVLFCVLFCVLCVSFLFFCVLFCAVYNRLHTLTHEKLCSGYGRLPRLGGGGSRGRPASGAALAQKIGATHLPAGATDTAQDNTRQDKADRQTDRQIKTRQDKADRSRQQAAHAYTTVPYLSIAHIYGS